MHTRTQQQNTPLHDQSRDHIWVLYIEKTTYMHACVFLQDRSGQKGVKERKENQWHVSVMSLPCRIYMFGTCKQLGKPNAKLL